MYRYFIILLMCVIMFATGYTVAQRTPDIGDLPPVPSRIMTIEEAREYIVVLQAHVEDLTQKLNENTALLGSCAAGFLPNIMESGGYDWSLFGTKECFEPFYLTLMEQDKECGGYIVYNNDLAEYMGFDIIEGAE